MTAITIIIKSVLHRLEFMRVEVQIIAEEVKEGEQYAPGVGSACNRSEYRESWGKW
jgi:hypothetical protein